MLVVAVVSFVLFLADCVCGAELLPIASASGKPVLIACDPGADTAEMGRYLQRFLSDRGFPAPLQRVTAKPGSSPYGGPLWLLSVDSSKFAKTTRDEGFIINAWKTAAGTPRLALTGKTPAGLRAAVARLLGKSANDGKTLWIEPGRELVDPFIHLRLMNVGQAARRQAPPGSRFEDANYETWDPKRIRAYPEMVWHLGFNGIQVDECRGYGSVKDDELVRVRKAVQSVSQGAHDWNLYVSFSQWGDVLFNEGETHCWNLPRQREQILGFIGDLARAYGPYVDNITCRFCDPGGCTSNGCDLYKTPQLVTTEYYRAFQKVNPRVSATLSLWANSHFWRYSPKPVDLENYSASFRNLSDTSYGRAIPDGAKFLDDTFMPPEVGLALHKYYNSDQAKAIADAGRPVDIKGWYIGDMEMNDNLTINMTAVNERFSSIPKEARDRVRMQTVEMCFHGWPQVINHYVAAQKLINPARPLNTLVREFCAATFGPASADAMADLYFACENGIERSPTSAIPWPAGFGTAAHNAKLREILARADAVKLPANWKPNFAFPVPAQKFLDMLRARLRLTLAVSEAKEAVDAARERVAVAKTGGRGSIHIDVQDEAGANIISTGGRDIALTTRLEKGKTIGQSFTASRAFTRIGVLCTKWGGGQAGFKMALYDAPGGKLLIYTVEQDVPDVEHVWLNTPRPAGTYYVEFSDPTGDRVGVYNSTELCPGGHLMADGKPVLPDDILQLAEQAEAEVRQIKENAVKNLPHLPIDPIYSQDASVIVQGYQTRSIPEMIMAL